jgi:hypothetical protein
MTNGIVEIVGEMGSGKVEQYNNHNNTPNFLNI